MTTKKNPSNTKTSGKPGIDLPEALVVMDSKLNILVGLLQKIHDLAESRAREDEIRRRGGTLQ